MTGNHEQEDDDDMEVDDSAAEDDDIIANPVIFEVWRTRYMGSCRLYQNV